jgi:hypothetical protein
MSRVWFRLVLSLIAAAATRQAVASDVGKDPRPLTPSEVGTFLPLICANPQKAPARPRHFDTSPRYRCTRIIGHPNDLRSIPKDKDGLPGFELALTAIAYGSFSKAGADEAQISYEGNFESHATNFGGTIFFVRRAGAWEHSDWLPGERMEHCVVLPIAQPEELLCLVSNGWADESYEEIGVVPILGESATAPKAGNEPASYYSLAQRVLAARTNGYDNCKDLKEDPDHSPFEQSACPAHQKGAGFLDRILDFKRSTHPGASAEATVTYIRPSDLERACSQTCFLDAPTHQGKIYFRAQGPTIRVDMPEGLNLQPEKSDM